MFFSLRFHEINQVSVSYYYSKTLHTARCELWSKQGKVIHSPRLRFWVEWESKRSRKELVPFSEPRGVPAEASAFIKPESNTKKLSPQKNKNMIVHLKKKECKQARIQYSAVPWSRAQPGFLPYGCHIQNVSPLLYRTDLHVANKRSVGALGLHA